MTTSAVRKGPTDLAGALAEDVRLPRFWLAAVNVAGGVAVLGSYVHGLSTRPDAGSALWGGVPDELRGLYTVSMFVAAAGYLLMAHYAYFRLAAGGATIGGTRVTSILTPLYVAVLLPSALWLPLTFRLVGDLTQFNWWLVRIDLAVVAIASIALTWVVAVAEPGGGRVRRRFAVIGGLAFCWQTAVLDALVWTFYFPV